MRIFLRHGQAQTVDPRSGAGTSWPPVNYGLMYLRNRMLSSAAMQYTPLVRRTKREVNDRNQALLADLATEWEVA